MDKFKILHLGGNEIFLPPYINFIKENFNFQQHKFLLTSSIGENLKYKNVRVFERKIFARLSYYICALIEIQKSNKIILHGIFDVKLLFVLLINPFCIKKCCWVLWGGDLYSYSLHKKNRFRFVKELIRRYVIRKVGVITTMVSGDFDLCLEWYHAKAKYIPNLMYLSHIARDENAAKCYEEKNSQIYIQIGNSSDPGNNHEEILMYLSKFKDRNMKVFCPLSYGQEEHRDYVIRMGKEMLGEKFFPITQIMSFEEYNNYMACIDVAIFNHDRQQAMGNIIGLLSLGKKVVIKKTITPYSFLREIGVSIHSMDDDLITPLDEETRSRNQSVMREYFSMKNLKMNWASVFNEK